MLARRGRTGCGRVLARRRETEYVSEEPHKVRTSLLPCFELIARQEVVWRGLWWRKVATSSHARKLARGATAEYDPMRTASREQHPRNTFTARTVVLNSTVTTPILCTPLTAPSSTSFPMTFSERHRISYHCHPGIIYNFPILVFLISPWFTTNPSSAAIAAHNLFSASGNTKLRLP